MAQRDLSTTVLARIVAPLAQFCAPFVFPSAENTSVIMAAFCLVDILVSVLAK